MGSRELPQKIWTLSAEQFKRIFDGNKQISKQTDREAKFINRRCMPVIIYISIIVSF